MSLDALRWALAAQTSNASQKLVLISLADRANEEMECYPSQERLERDTTLNIKTIKKCLKELCEQGFIDDTGKRVGKTNRTKVYQLTGIDLRELAPFKPAQKRYDSKNGPIKKPTKDNKPNKGPIKSDQKRADSDSNESNSGLNNEPKNGSIKSAQIWATEPPNVLTTHSNHPTSCSHLADASDSPLSKNDNASDDKSDQAAETIEVVSGWTFANLIDPTNETDSGAFIALPLRSDQPEPVHLVTDEEIIQWSQLYQTIDVASECRLMLGWLIGNPGKRKTRAGMLKFITGWLSKASNAGGSPYLNLNKSLVDFEKTRSDDSPKAKRERVREALRDIAKTDW